MPRHSRSSSIASVTKRLPAPLVLAIGIMLGLLVARVFMGGVSTTYFKENTLVSHKNVSLRVGIHGQTVEYNLVVKPTSTRLHDTQSRCLIQNNEDGLWSCCRHSHPTTQRSARDRHNHCMLIRQQNDTSLCSDSSPNNTLHG